MNKITSAEAVRQVTSRRIATVRPKLYCGAWWCLPCKYARSK